MKISAPSSPTIKATRSPNADGLLVYIEPGEGKAEAFEAVVLDANKREITRETIIPEKGRDEVNFFSS